MARPTRSRIIPADSHNAGKIEKWPMSKLRSTTSNIVPLVSRPRKAAIHAVEEDHEVTGHGSGESENSATAGADRPLDEATSNGYSDEMQAALSQIAEQQKQLAALLTALENPVRSLNDTVARELLMLSQDIARSVLQREVQQDPALLGEFIKSAIAQLPAAIDPPVIHAHPEDLQILKELASHALNKVSIDWMEDAQAERGNFVVERGDSVIHGGIDAMLQRVLDQSDVTR